MFRKYKIRRKARKVIKLLKEYFKDRDYDVYSALCNCKRRDVSISDEKSIYIGACNDFEFIVNDADDKVVIESWCGNIYKVYVNDRSVTKVTDFHKLLNLNESTMCTWDMIIDYLLKEG